jgi:glycosyltransferase involved in cell wall biosynthesis
VPVNPIIDGLAARLLSAAPHLGWSADDAAAIARRGPGPLINALARRVADEDAREGVWLLVAAMTASLPTAAEVLRVQRELRRSTPARVHRVLLEAAIRVPGSFVDPVPRAEVVSGVVVDVDFSATTTHNTGVQRVVRQTMARWTAEHELIPVAWSSDSESFRDLRPSELRRVVDWAGATAADASADAEPEPQRLIPFNSTVVLFEVAQLARCAPLAALAEYSGNRLAIVGHDAIPVVSAGSVPEEETERYVHFLSVVKHGDRLAGVSASATDEYAAFASSLAAQGLNGPETVEVLLPVDVPQHLPVVAQARDDDPLILCVGSHEPRKNQLALLHAADSLWREGLRFRLRLIGGGSLWFTRVFDGVVRDLRRAGRPIEVLRGASDDQMLASYGEASFSVFPSLHEGYGLPVAESLALGVPVITTAYGSTAEIARGGGCVLVDPRDDEQIIDAMRRLLTQPAELARLRAEIAARPARTWDDYATELWGELVEPLITSTAADR